MTRKASTRYIWQRRRARFVWFSEESKAMPMPARGKCISRRTVVPRIGVDISVPRIEAVIAIPSAAVAPVPATPRRPDVLSPRPVARPKVRCLRRGTGAAESGGGYQNCEYLSLHIEEGHDVRSELHPGSVVSPQSAIPWQIKTAKLVKYRQPIFANSSMVRHSYVSGRVSENMSTIVLVIAFTINTWSLIFTYL